MKKLIEPFDIDWARMERILNEAFDKVYAKLDAVNGALENHPTKTDLANELIPIHTELIDINLRLDRALARDPSHS